MGTPEGTEARVARMQPEERRRELLEVAGELFFRHGYERTSVEMIIGAAGVSKGAFYHHFDSKESMLEAFAARIAEQSLARAAVVLEAPFPSAIHRLNAFWDESRRLNVEVAPVARRVLGAIFRPENLVLRHRISALTIALTAPLLARILEEGAREGVLDAADPLGTAELLLHLGTGVHDVIGSAIAASDAGETEAAAELLERRLRLYEVAFNRVLGLADGTISIVEPGFARAMLSA